MTKPSLYIFDLDGTLVDTSKLDSFRREKRWSECIRNVSLSTVYPNIHDAVTLITQSGVKWAVVTRSVSNYADAILNHHSLRPDILIAYHDCKKQKPAPDPVLLAIERASASAQTTVCFGDASTDADAYSSANAYAVGAGWSASFQPSAGWNEVSQSTSDMLRRLEARLKPTR